MEWVFWGSLVLIIYSYVGYPLLLAILSFFYKLLLGSSRASKKAPDKPSVSIVLVAHNEEERVLERIENLLQADYGKVEEVLVICDRGNDNTGPVVASAVGADEAGGIGQWVRVVELERGKDGRAAGLNQAVAIAKGDVVVFADIGQRFASDTVSQLVAPFKNKRVGAVTGWLEVAEVEGGSTRVPDVYRELEKMIQEKESDFASTIACNRAVYAVRGDAYKAIDEDTIADDLVVPMKIALGGYRVLFAPAALAYDLRAAGRRSDLSKIKDKAPLLAGHWQAMFRYPGWLFPWGNRLAWQLFSHSYLRLLNPMLLLVLLLSNLVLLSTSWIFWLSFFGQVVCYGLGVAGLFRVSFPWNFASLLSRIAGGFLVQQALNAWAFIYWLRGQITKLRNPNSEPRMTKLR